MCTHVRDAVWLPGEHDPGQYHDSGVGLMTRILGQDESCIFFNQSHQNLCMHTLQQFSLEEALVEFCSSEEPTGLHSKFDAVTKGTSQDLETDMEKEVISFFGLSQNLSYQLNHGGMLMEQLTN